VCGRAAQVEFNKAALSLSDAIPADGRKAALNRLLKARPIPQAQSSLRMAMFAGARALPGVTDGLRHAEAPRRSRSGEVQVRQAS
jgi:hypothetical protein